MPKPSEVIAETLEKMKTERERRYQALLQSQGACEAVEIVLREAIARETPTVEPAPPAEAPTEPPTESATPPDLAIST